MTLWLLFWLLTKHFIVDGPLQPKWMYANKGTFVHPGGLVHAGLHGVATFFILMLVAPNIAFNVASIECVAHYLIDYTKMNLNRIWGLKPDNSESFWWLLLFDQYLHGLCYLLIAWVVTWPF